jgi:hypothetical protein
LNHWLTAPLLTPSPLAIFEGCQPFSFNFQACRRLASRHSVGRFSVMPIVYHNGMTSFRKLFLHQ